MRISIIPNTFAYGSYCIDAVEMLLILLLLLFVIIDALFLTLRLFSKRRHLSDTSVYNTIHTYIYKARTQHKA